MNHIKTKEFVIDSSIFVKLFLDENDQKNALRFFNEVSEKKYLIHAPKIFLYEVLNVCANKKLDAKPILKLLSEYQKSNLQIIDPTQEIMLSAIDMTKLGHAKSGYPSFYDCVYHALAIEKKCQFITSDSKHISKSKMFGFVKDLSELYE